MLGCIVKNAYIYIYILGTIFSHEMLLQQSLPFLIIIVHCGFSEICEKFGLFSFSQTEPDKFSVRHPVVLSAFTNSTCTQAQHCCPCWCTSDTIDDDPKKLKPSILFPNFCPSLYTPFPPRVEACCISFFSAVVRVFINERFALPGNVIK